jgi:hypothetical protein
MSQTSRLGLPQILKNLASLILLLFLTSFIPPITGSGVFSGWITMVAALSAVMQDPVFNMLLNFLVYSLYVGFVVLYCWTDGTQENKAKHTKYTLQQCRLAE